MKSLFFLVEASLKGLSLQTEVLLDAGTYASLELNEVEISTNDRAANRKRALLEQLNNTAAICLSAEMMGMIHAAYGQTIAYLQERQQFGKRIGSYQALQHRAAKLFCEIELCKSIVIKALKALDEVMKILLNWQA